jgi:hypothetical protein
MRDAVEDLCSFAGRGPCTDAERRAALWLHDDLRSRGHEAWVETVWVRPQWPWSLALHSALGIAASLTSTAASLVIPSLVVAALAFLSFGLELAGRPGLSTLLFFRRATQLVVVEPAVDGVGGKVILWITANVDAPPRGVVFRDGWRRLGARLRPGPLVWVLIALGGVAAACAARVAGAEGTLLGALQFVPTLVLLLAATAALDVALSAVAPGASDNASGVAAALALHEELSADPPERLAPALLLAGAGELFPFGFRAHLRAERPQAVDTVFLELGPCGDGVPAWHTAHPQLGAAAASVSEPAATRRRPRRPSATGAAHQRRLPAILVRAVDRRNISPRARTGADLPDTVLELSMQTTVDFCLALVDALDAELAVAEPVPAGPLEP